MSRMKSRRTEPATPPRELTVELGSRSYPIHVGPGLLTDEARFAEALPGGPVLIVTNDVVAPLYLDTLVATLARRDPQILILPDGERHKNLENFTRIIDALARQGVTRDGVIVALGGGVVGDVAGFAAATYMRGIAFLPCPTTLLAQVDASVGGKTAVNHPAGKNLVGAFHQPVAVVMDTDTLATLPEREFRAGLAEVIKAALIRDAEFFGWLEENAQALMARRNDTLSSAIERACRIKADIVAADERERGERALLNLGHTFAHAIETETGYSRLLHGEAVAMGLVMAARLSCAKGLLKPQDADRIAAVLAKVGLDTAPPGDLEPERLLQRMYLDKKALAGRLRLVLLERIGHAVVRDDLHAGSVRDAMLAAG